MNKKIASLIVGLFVLVPPMAFAQTASQEELIKQLTAQAAKLQAQLDALRQTMSSRPSTLEQQLTEGSAEFVKQFQEKIKQAQSNPAQAVINPARPLPPAEKAVPVKNDAGDEPSMMTASFDRNLSFGMRNDSDVSNLQKFLTEQGFYNNTVSGNFFILTRNAVKKFQSNHNLKPTGYFGPATRAIANEILAGGETPPTPPPDASRGHLSIQPSYAMLRVGERVEVQAYYQPSLPACLHASPPCALGMMEPAPTPVVALFTSDNPGIAAADQSNKDCSPPRACPVSITRTYVRGVSAGSAVITAAYKNEQRVFTAQMKVSVISKSAVETIIRKVGEQEGSFLIQKINPDSVEGLSYQAYPVAIREGTQKTLHTGDDIGYACEGVSEKLTSIDSSGQRVTFAKVIGQPPYGGCPICLSSSALIDTPSGFAPVKDMRAGMPVWTMDKSGQRVLGVITKTSKVSVPPTHEMVHVVLDDGRGLFVSPGHPTVDGRTVRDLMVGDLYGGAHVVSVSRVVYGDLATYDILPSGETGFYWANGILLGSTLH